MAEGVTYAIDVLFRGKDQGASKAYGDMAKHASVAAAKQRDFSKSLLYKRDALKDASRHLAFGARRTRDFSSALHGTMARNRTDQIKRWFGSIREGAKGAQSPLSGLGGTLATMAAIGAGGLFLGKKAFIDFNNTIEMSTISLAAQEKMLLGGSWSSAMGNATGLFKDYQQVAAKSIGSTSDYLDMHKGIASSAYRAGLGMAELKSMTIGATVAAISLGERADMVALDIKQMLSGDVTSRDRTAQILLASQGVGQDAFNKMKAKDRNKIVMAGLNDPALKAAAKAYGNTFAGALSAFQDNLQITMAKVGLPLFKAVTKEIQRWNTWVEKNPEVIGRWARDFKNALVDGFNAVKSAMSWIVENKGLLLKLAEAALVMKGASMAGGLLKAAAGAGPLGAMGKMAATAGVANFLGMGTFQTALVSVTSALGPLGLAVSATALGMQGLANLYDRQQTKDITRRGDMSVLRQNLGRFGGSAFSMTDPNARKNASFAVLRAAGDAGIYGKNGLSREGAYKAMYGDVGTAMMLSNGGSGTPEAEALIQEIRAALYEPTGGLTKLLDASKKANDGLSVFSANFARVWNDPFHGGLKGLLGLTMLPTDAKKDPTKGKVEAIVNVYNTIYSDDPDRIAVPLSNGIKKALANPGGARKALTIR